MRVPLRDSHERTAALIPWVEHDNTVRPQAALAHRPPASQLGQLRFLGSTEGTVPPSRPAMLHDRSAGVAPRSAAGDRRQPARSVLAASRRTGHARTEGSTMLIHLNNPPGHDS